MRAAVITFPGSNRDGDVIHALVGAGAARIDTLWHADTDLPAGTDLVVLPGGFSYGDYLRCGAIAARAPIMAAVHAHVARGGFVLGICNGFQILIEAGLLPGALMRNKGMHFICRRQTLTISRNDTPFARAYKAGQTILMPIAHGEGNFFCDNDTLKRLEGEGRIALRYGQSAHYDAGQALANPNGSRNNIAGVYGANGHVLGLMPHPENAIEPEFGGVDGKWLFKSLVG